MRLRRWTGALVAVALVLATCSCGTSSTVARYEPEMSVVVREAQTITTLLENGDYNQDGRLNWWEMLVVANTWLTQLQRRTQGGQEPERGEG